MVYNFAKGYDVNTNMSMNMWRRTFFLFFLLLMVQIHFVDHYFYNVLEL